VKAKLATATRRKAARVTIIMLVLPVLATTLAILKAKIEGNSAPFGNWLRPSP
jgi:hypothetical protein